DGMKFLLVHATPRDPLDEYAPAEVEFWRRRLENVSADFVCVGHTHVAYELFASGTRVINPGSVGLPRDGDPRASYAILEDTKVTFHRAEYDVSRTLEVLAASTIPDQAKTTLADVYRTGTLPNGNGKPKSLNGVGVLPTAEAGKMPAIRLE